MDMELLLIVAVAALIVESDLLEDLLSNGRIVAPGCIVIAEGDLTTIVVLTDHEGVYYGHSIFIKKGAWVQHIGMVKCL